jgi:hypothetical protein
VDGIIFHPNEKDLCYCRTDMGGAFKRNPEAKIWKPLLDRIPYEDMSLMGVESIALDPSDPGRVYLSCGTYLMEELYDLLTAEILSSEPICLLKWEAMKTDGVTGNVWQSIRTMEAFFFWDQEKPVYGKVQPMVKHG